MFQWIELNWISENYIKNCKDNHIQILKSSHHLQRVPSCPLQSIIAPPQPQATPDLLSP